MSLNLQGVSEFAARPCTRCQPGDCQVNSRWSVVNPAQGSGAYSAPQCNTLGTTHTPWQANTFLLVVSGCFKAPHHANDEFFPRCIFLLTGWRKASLYRFSPPSNPACSPRNVSFFFPLSFVPQLKKKKVFILRGGFFCWRERRRNP